MNVDLNNVKLKDVFSYYMNQKEPVIGSSQPSSFQAPISFSSANAELYISPQGLAFLAMTEAYQNLYKTNHPERTNTRIDFNTICNHLGKEIEQSVFSTGDATFDKRIVDYAKINYIADTACKLLSLILLINNYRALNKKKVSSIQDMYKEILEKKVTLAYHGEYTTTGVNTAPVCDHFLGKDQYTYKEIKNPGSQLFEFAKGYPGRLVHLRTFSNLQSQKGAHSITCMYHSSLQDAIYVFDTAHLDNNYTTWTSEHLRANTINGKGIAYAGVIF